MGKNKRAISLLVSIFLLLTLVGCGSMDKSEETKAPENYEASKEYAMDSDSVSGGFENRKEEAYESNDDKAKGKSEENSPLEDSGRKIIKSGHMEMETKTFDKTIDSIINRLNEVGGYIENTNITGTRINNEGTNERRTARLVLRIPEDYFDEYIREVGNLGNVTLNNQNGQDITGEYFDSEARLKSLEIQEERLLSILKEAKDIKDIIELERELSELRYRIENLTGTIRKWDNLISYSTLRINIYEVYEIKKVKMKPITLGQRMKDGFTNSIDILVDLWKNVMVLISALLPFIIIFGPILLVVLYILNKIRRKNNKNIEE